MQNPIPSRGLKQHLYAETDRICRPHHSEFALVLV